MGHLAELQGAQALRRRWLPSQVLQEAPDEGFWGTHTKASTDDAKERQSPPERGGKEVNNDPNRGSTGPLQAQQRPGIEQEQRKFGTWGAQHSRFTKSQVEPQIGQRRATGY